MNIRLIACVDEGFGLGMSNKLLYNIKDDMCHFKNLTKGQAVVMGRKTYESLPGGILKDRENFIISKSMGLVKGAHIYRSVNDFLIGGRHHPAIKDKRVYVIGGGQIYSQFIDHANYIDLTIVAGKKPADSFFPSFDSSVWEIEMETEMLREGDNVYRYLSYKRKKLL